MAKVDGKVVLVGDWVCFKSDIEQSGKIESINGTMLSLTNDNGFEGDYIGGSHDHMVEADRCWLEG